MQEDVLVIGVYTIRHLTTGGFYIGSSENYPQRKQHHIYHLRTGIHGNKNLQELYCRSPELAWEFTPCVTHADALRLEEQLIRQNWGKPGLCNIAFGGSGWHAGTMPLDVRQKIAATKTGTRLSDETKALMSSQRTGKKKSTEWSNKIAEASRLKIKVGDVIYSGCKAAAEAYGIHPNTVSERAKSDSKKFSDWSIVEK